MGRFNKKEKEGRWNFRSFVNRSRTSGGGRRFFYHSLALSFEASKRPWSFRQVFDYDWGLQDDFMGAAQFDLAQLDLGQPQDIVLELKDHNRPKQHLGEIYLTATLWPKNQQEKEQVFILTCFCHFVSIDVFIYRKKVLNYIYYKKNSGSNVYAWKSKIQLIPRFVLSGKLNFLLTEQLGRISASSTGVRLVILLR